MGGRGASSSTSKRAFSSNTSNIREQHRISYEEFMSDHIDADGYAHITDEERQYLFDKGLNDHLFQLYMNENGDYASPEIMDDAKFDDYVKANGLQVINRGVNNLDDLSAEDIHKAFMQSGPYYIGNGIYGNGMYFGSEYKTAVSYATEYGSGGATIRAALKQNAKTITYDDLTDLMIADGIKKYYESDHISIYARSKGYDAIIRDTGYDGIYTNVINRGALVISSKITKHK